MILSLLCVAKAEAQRNRWISSGPDGGGVSSITFGSVGSHAMYCVAGPGVFRSTDQGDSWTGTDTQNVYVMTSEPNSGPFLFAIGGSAYRSSDSGATWISESSPPSPNFDGALAIDSGDPNIVYAGFFGGMFRTTDGGGSWQETALTGVAPVAAIVDPRHPGVIYVSSPDPFACPGSCLYDVYGIWKSTDYGATWAQPPGLPDDIFYTYTLTIDQSNPNTIYAGGVGEMHGMALFKSTDGGDHWNEADNGMNHVPEQSYVSAIAVDPHESATVYASSDQGLWKSTDGAATWNLLVPGAPLSAAIGIDPENTSRLFRSDSSGLHRSLDGGRSWQLVNNGRPFASITCLTADPSDVRTVFAGDNNNGLFRSTDAGASWQSVAGDLSFDSVTSVSVDPFQPSRLYATLLLHGVYSSTDFGASWANVLPQPSGSCCAFEVATTTETPGLIYATTDRGLHLSHDAGATWGFLRPDMRKVVPEPRRPGWLYGLGTGPEGIDDVLLRSTDGGRNWSEIGPFVPGTSLRQYLYAISLDPADPDVLYGGAGNNGFFVTRDGGETWSHDPFVGASSTAVLPGTPERIFAGDMGTGVTESADGGATWSSINDGLRDLNVTSVLAAGGIIHAGTSSAAVFEYLPVPDRTSPITVAPPARVGGRPSLAQSGTWGSSLASLTTTNSDATLQILASGGCYGSYGNIGAPIPWGPFTLTGTFTQLIGAYPGMIQYDANFSGSAAGNQMVITVAVPALQESFGPFDLIYGVQSSWQPCRYPAGQL